MPFGTRNEYSLQIAFRSKPELNVSKPLPPLSIELEGEECEVLISDL